MIYHILQANYAHLIPDILKSILGYADQTNKGGVNEHYFLLITNKKVKYSKKFSSNYEEYISIFQDYNFKNYSFVDTSLSQIKYLLSVSKKDKLLIHDKSILFGSSVFFWLFMFMLGKKYGKRANIINWGVGSIKPKGEMKKASYLLFKIKRHVLKSFQYVITLTTEDKNKIQEQYNLTNVITTIYIHDAYRIFKGVSQERNKDRITRIMVSHSGWEHNNHIQTFKLLERFKNENIEVICPLCYGNDKYIEQVKKEGKQMFGEKFKFFHKLLPLNDYYKLLSGINIFIANTSLQTGLHVVHFGLCTGFKMYLKDNIYNSLKAEGFYTNNILELDSVTFNDFCSPIQPDWYTNNDVTARNFFSIKSRSEIWKKIYE